VWREIVKYYKILAFGTKSCYIYYKREKGKTYRFSYEDGWYEWHDSSSWEEMLEILRKCSATPIEVSPLELLVVCGVSEE